MSTPTTTNLEALKLAHDAAQAALAKLREEKSSKRYTALSALTKDLDASLSSEYDARLTKLAKELNVARAAYETAKIEEATNSTEGYTVGTRVVKKEVKWSTWDRRDAEGKATIVAEGVIEVWVPGVSIHAVSLEDYRTPKAGTKVIRILKKSGEPSTKFIPMGQYNNVAKFDCNVLPPEWFLAE